MVCFSHPFTTSFAAVHSVHNNKSSNEGFIIHLIIICVIPAGQNRNKLRRNEVFAFAPALPGINMAHLLS